LNPPSPGIDRVIKWGLLGLIAFTPLAFGTVEVWSIAVMEWGIVTLLLVLGLRRVLASPASSPARRLRTGLEIPVVLFLFFCALQTVPLPPRWLDRVSPGSGSLYRGQDFRTIAEERRPGVTRDRLDDPLLRQQDSRPRPVSVRPRETWAKVRLMAAFSGLVLLVVAWADSGQRIVFLLSSVTAVGFLVAVQGLIQFLAPNGKIYWVRRSITGTGFGPFVNHNHFAGYVEMVIPVAVSLAFYLIEFQEPARPRAPRAADPRNLAGARQGFVEETGRWGRSALAVFAAAILLVSLFFCLSRGGIVSAGLSGLILFALLWRRIGSRRVAWSFAIAIPLLVAALIGWIGPGVVTHQLGTYQTVGGEASFRLRAMVWKSLLGNQPRFLWAGSGLGTFEDTFAPFTPPGATARWDKAHNDYLQLLWETGVVGATLFVVTAGIFLRRYWWRAIHAPTHPLGLFRIGIAVSLLSIALHSLVDFNLQIGANGFLFALLSGILIALHREIEESGREWAVQRPDAGS
jgi:hypothetical protein